MAKKYDKYDVNSPSADMLYIQNNSLGYRQFDDLELFNIVQNSPVGEGRVVRVIDIWKGLSGNYLADYTVTNPEGYGSGKHYIKYFDKRSAKKSRKKREITAGEQMGVLAAEAQQMTFYARRVFINHLSLADIEHCLINKTPVFLDFLQYGGYQDICFIRLSDIIIHRLATNAENADIKAEAAWIEKHRNNREDKINSRISMEDVAEDDDQYTLFSKEMHRDDDEEQEYEQAEAVDF